MNFYEFFFVIFFLQKKREYSEAAGREIIMR